MTEDYTFGYGQGSVALMALRSAESHAQFFLPWLQAGMQLLDVGCGPGSVTLGLARCVAPGAVIGSELDLTQTQHAAEQARREQLNVTFEQADVYALPYPG